MAWVCVMLNNTKLSHTYYTNEHQLATSQLNNYFNSRVAMVVTEAFMCEL